MEISYNHKDIIHALNNPEFSFKINPFGEKMEIIERIDNDTVILYMKFKGMLIVSGRDFVFWNRKTLIEDHEDPTIKSNSIISFSVDHPRSPECPQNAVRADMIIAGWICKEIDEWNTLVTNFGINDLKGSIPKFVINASVSTHSGILVNLMKQLDVLSENNQLLSQLKGKDILIKI